MSTSSRTAPRTTLDSINPANWGYWIRVVTSFVAMLLYGFLFVFLLYPRIGLPSSALIILPTALIGWMFGLRGGFISGIIGAAFNALLFYIVGENGFAILFGGGFTGSLTVVGIAAVLGWVSDTLSRIRNLANELEISRAAAEEASELKTEFLSKVSHELRTPLNAILGYAELVSGGVYGTVNKQQGEKLSAIINSTKELNIMVDNLLEVSLMQITSLTIHITPFSIYEMLQNVHARLQPWAEEKGLRFTSQLDQDFTVTSDRLRVSQILSNLAENAIKYTSQGKVHIHIYQIETHKFCISVEDTGKGISEEAQGYIFDAFRQVPIGSADTSPGGIGLGLAIVQDITDSLGGHVTLESTLGQGSRFIVTLPTITEQEKEEL